MRQDEVFIGFFLNQNTNLGLLRVVVNEIKLYRDCFRVAFKGTLRLFPLFLLLEVFLQLRRRKKDLKKFLKALKGT